jgi:type II secretory pathway component GspD/PulD (secretin)
MSAQWRPVKRWGLRIIVSVFFSCTIALHASVSSAQQAFQIESRGDLIWLNAEDADLRQVLQHFANEREFKLWISADLPVQSVQISSEGKSTEDTLRRLLSENSYALVYDDNARISALYVLSAGESRPTNLSLSPSNDDSQQQVLLEALASPQLPDNVKAAMLNQFGANQQDLQESVLSQRSQALQQLTDKLEQIGSPDEATMQQLRRQLEIEFNLQTE